jgi:transposase
MRKIREILRLRYDLKCSYSEIARSIKIGQSTVGDCINRAKQAGISWPLPEKLDDAKLEVMLYKSSDNQSVSGAKNIDFAYIHKELKRKGVTKQLLWYEYKEKNPDGLGYSRFCSLYREWAKTLNLSMRQIHKLGEKLFIDYAGMTVPIIIDTKTGEIKEAQIFAATFGASNYTYAEATWTQNLSDWIGSHVNAFDFFGGVPEILVPDNLKSAVTKAHRYEPDLNPTYQDMAQHYGVAVIPARVRKPKDKAKAEQAVLHIERRILAKLRNRRFFSLNELNQAIKVLLEQVNRQPFQKLPGSRLSQFETLEKPTLRPLPNNRYEFAEWKKAKAGVDYHIALDGCYYSVPFTYVKKELDVRYTTHIVEVFYKNNRIASHRRHNKKGKYTTLVEHMPKSHQKYAEWTPNRIINWARTQGSYVGLFAKKLIEQYMHPQQGFRSCMGLIRLGKTYNKDRLNKACQRALAIKAFGYKSVQSILKNNLDQQPLAQTADEKQVTACAHDNVRGENYYC